MKSKWSHFLYTMRRHRREINQLIIYVIMLGAGVFALLAKLPTFVQAFPDWRDVVLKIALPIATVLIAVASVFFLYLTPWRKFKSGVTVSVGNVKISNAVERAKSALSLIHEPRRGGDLDQFEKHIVKLEEARKALSSELENPLRLIDEQCERLTSRLNEEVEALGKRANINLFIGVLTTILGLSALSVVAFQDLGWLGTTTGEKLPKLKIPILTTNTIATKQYSTNSVPELKSESSNKPDWSLFIYHYIPKLSLVLFIELFAFFFLKLYKLNLGEIKYFQNEITNIQSKGLALRVAVSKGNSEHIGEVLKGLSQTERNTILQKDQTTVDLEKAKLEIGSYKEAFTKLVDVFGKK